MRSILGMLRRRIRSIALGTVVVLAAVATLTAWMPRTYRSGVTFLLERPSGGTPEALSVLERASRANTVDTEVGLMQGRSVGEAVVDELDLHVSLEDQDPIRPRQVLPSLEADRDAVEGIYALSAGPAGTIRVTREADGQSVTTVAEGDRIRFAGLSVRAEEVAATAGVTLRVEHFSKAVSDVQSRLQASALTRDSDLVGLACDGPTARLAHELCQAISRAYIEQRTALVESEASSAARFIGQQVEQVGARLQEAEDSLRTYEIANNVIDLEERAAVGVRNYADLEAQRLELRAEGDALSTLIDRIEAGDADSRRYRDLASFPTFLRSQNQVVTQLTANLVDLDNRRNDLALSRSDTNVDVAALDRRIEDLEQQLFRVAQGYADAINVQITSIDSALATARADLIGIPDQLVEVARRSRQVSLLEDLYRMLQTRQREAEVAEAVHLPSVRIVDAASLPFEPESPSVPLNLAIGLILGLASGLGLALLREDSDTSFRELDQLEAATGVPVFGMIPRLKKAGPLLHVSPSANGGGTASEKKPKHSRDGEIALEAFRSIATEIHFAARASGTDRFRSLAVTSASSGEGKTFVSCNLAIALADLGVETVLIDGDVRAKGVGRFFELPPRTPGLTEALEGQIQPSEAMHPVRVKYRTGLELMTSGTLTDRAAELLGISRLTGLLSRFRDTHEMVIVDTPPLNVLTDTAAIASVVDAVLVVVREGTTDMAALDLTLARLARANARVIGMVMNHAHLPGHYRSYSHVYP